MGRDALSYQIEYPVTNSLEKQYNRKTERKRTRIAAVVIIGIVTLAVSVYMLGVDTVRDFLIPGNDEVTISAFRQMHNNLSNGMSAADAVTAFCTEILHSAKTQ